MSNQEKDFQVRYKKAFQIIRTINGLSSSRKRERFKELLFSNFTI